MANISPLLLNGVYSTVQAGSSAIGSSSATGVNVATGDGAKFGTIGTNQFIPAVIVDTSTSPETIKEYVWVTSRSTDALTVVRQAEDSSTYAASTTSIAAGYTIAAVATRNALDYLQSISAFRARDHGWITQNWPAEIYSQAGVTPTSGAIYLARVAIPMTVSVTNIIAYVSAFGSGLTSGQNLAGIYDSSGTLLGQTADQTTSWGGSSGLKTMAISGGAISVSGGPDTFVYVALLGVGTTPSKFARTSCINASAFTNAGLTTATSLWLRAATSQTSLPSTLTLSSGDFTGLQDFWAALS